MAATPAYVGCDSVLFIKNVKDRSGTLITNGTCNYTIVSRTKINGAYVTVDSGVLPHVGSGRYEKVIEGSVMSEMVVGVQYNVRVEFSDPSGNNLRKTLVVYAAEQQEGS